MVSEMNGHDDVGAFSLPYGITETIRAGEQELKRMKVPKPYSFVDVTNERFVRESVVLDADLDNDRYLQVYDDDLLFECGDGHQHTVTVRCYGD